MNEVRSSTLTYDGEMSQNQKTVFITGASGYIGSNLAYSFFGDEVNLVLIDSNEIRGFPSLNENATYEFGNLLDSDFINYLSSKYNYVEPESVLIHLAASKSVSESAEFPEKYLIGNLSATRNVISFLNRVNVRNLIFASTAAVYGNPTIKGRISEKCQPNPMSPYAESKLLCERFIENEGGENLRFAILRLFNVVGALSPDYLEKNGSNLIPTILKNLSEGIPTSIFGSDFPTRDGTCERDYIDVRDLISAIRKCIDLLPAKRIGTLNLGTGVSHTVLDVVKSIEKRLGKVEISLQAARVGDPSSVIADIEKATLDLDWSPKYDLDSSIHSMTSHLKSH